MDAEEPLNTGRYELLHRSNRAENSETSAWRHRSRRAAATGGRTSDQLRCRSARRGRNYGAGGLNTSDMSLSLRRARTTWVTAHLEAGTALPVLPEIVGPLATATLDDLLVATAAVTSEQAVRQALRA